jgi:hypothetical protein
MVRIPVIWVILSKSVVFIFEALDRKEIHNLTNRNHEIHVQLETKLQTQHIFAPFLDSNDA